MKRTTIDITQELEKYADKKSTGQSAWQTISTIHDILCRLSTPNVNVFGLIKRSCHQTLIQYNKTKDHNLLVNEIKKIEQMLNKKG